MTSEIKNRKPKSGTAPAAFKTAEFINHNFTADDKGRFKVWAVENAASLGDIIDKLVDDGYSISIKFDTYTEAYACFLQNRDEKSVNHGFILTGRSRCGSMAVLAAAYRHYVIFEGTWPVRDVRNNSLDDE